MSFSTLKQLFRLHVFFLYSILISLLDKINRKHRRLQSILSNLNMNLYYCFVLPLFCPVFCSYNNSMFFSFSLFFIHNAVYHAIILHVAVKLYTKIKSMQYTLRTSGIRAVNPCFKDLCYSTRCRFTSARVKAVLPGGDHLRFLFHRSPKRG